MHFDLRQNILLETHQEKDQERKERQNSYDYLSWDLHQQQEIKWPVCAF